METKIYPYAIKCVCQKDGNKYFTWQDDLLLCMYTQEMFICLEGGGVQEPIRAEDCSLASSDLFKWVCCGSVVYTFLLVSDSGNTSSLMCPD